MVQSEGGETRRNQLVFLVARWLCGEGSTGRQQKTNDVLMKWVEVGWRAHGERTVTRSFVFDANGLWVRGRTGRKDETKLLLLLL